MRWLFYIVGVVALLGGFAIFFTGPFITQQIMGAIVALFGLVALGFGAMIGKRN